MGLYGQVRQSKQICRGAGSVAKSRGDRCRCRRGGRREEEGGGWDTWAVNGLAAGTEFNLESDFAPTWDVKRALRAWQAFEDSHRGLIRLPR